MRAAQTAERVLDTFGLGRIIASSVFFHLVSAAVSTNRIRPANLSWRHCEVPKCCRNTLFQDKLSGQRALLFDLFAEPRGNRIIEAS